MVPPRSVRGTRLHWPLLLALLAPVAQVALAGGGGADTEAAAAFAAWLRDAGADCSGLALRHSPQRGWHAVAARDAAPGEVVASVPLAAALSSDGSALQLPPESHAALSAAGMAEYGRELALVAELLRERRAADSPRAPHLRMMPQSGDDFRTGLWWDERDEECASVHARAVRQHQLKQFAAFAEAVRPALAGLSAPVTDDELRWAYSAVMTRAVSSGSASLLVPFVDMLNHDGSAARNAVAVQVEGQAVQLVAQGGGLSEGAEVTLSYGAHLTPAKLLVYYGFADDTFSRVYSHVEFPSEAAELAAAGCGDREAMWIARGGEVSPKVLECVLLAVLPAANRTAWAGLDAESRAELMAARRLDVLQVLSSHLGQVLGSYPHKWDAACDSEHHLIPLIRDANAKVRQVFLDAKGRLDEEVRESGTARIVTTQQQESRRRRRRRPARADGDPEPERDPFANTEAFAKWMAEHKEQKRAREEERRSAEQQAEWASVAAAANQLADEQQPQNSGEAGEL